MSVLSSMEAPTVDVDLSPEKIENEKEGGPMFHCDLHDTEVVHKLAQMFLPGLASACVDHTTGAPFNTPGSVADDLRKEMIDYLTQRSESFVAESVILDDGADGEVSDHPFDIISCFVDDFVDSKRNLFSQVSGWLLSDKREDKIDDFVQEMETNGFWLLDKREKVAENLLKNVDFKNSFHCSASFINAEDLANHFDNCNFRPVICNNVGCNARFSAVHLKEHDMHCPFKIIPCEQKCTDNIMRREMDRHCITVCPMKLVNCPFYAVGCRSAIAQCMVGKHCSDDLQSHLLHLLKGIHKDASGGDLNRRVELIVQGYVKIVTPKGCFILLSRKIEARILLSNLSDQFVTDLEKEFPVGKLVIGRVVSAEPLSNRVEVTLKTSTVSSTSKSEISDLGKFHVGDVISGRIKRVESFGLFIAIDDTNVVGLCHVSEISDNRIENIEAKFGAGEKVNAIVLKVDEERHRISLGMKNSYMRGETVLQIPLDEGSNEPVADGMKKSTSSTNSILLGPSNMDVEYETDQFPILSQAEERAYIPPLDVALDDFDQFEVNNTNSHGEEGANEEGVVNEKQKRREKKKAKEEREKQIRAAEERLLEEDVPRTADEFEKLVRSSPNSSFNWIKYMDFMISLADVEKARSIAERALKTINFREMDEKFNICKAYLNLENMYGNPKKEAIEKVFKKALEFYDGKKVYLALLGMYERTEQHSLADELLNKMTKEFKHSCKVWLRRVQSLLLQKQDAVQPVVDHVKTILPQHKHVKFISQTAILEFKIGVPDRGRSLFEEILRKYPKRTDLWSVYLDQEIKLKDENLIRALFERAISLSLPPKKMKFLFKKYLDYEKSQGDEERIEAVKRKALEYIENMP